MIRCSISTTLEYCESLGVRLPRATHLVVHGVSERRQST